MFNPAMFDSMKHMMNPAMMKQSAEMMSKMSDEELKQYMGMAGMNVDPAMLRAASSNMAKMDDSTLENMKNTAASRLPTASPPVFTPSTSTNSNDEISLPLGLKNQGNDLFKQGRISDAAIKYRMGISEIEKLPMSKAMSDLEVTLRMNLAACLVKEQDYDEVILQCKKALVLGENAKAFYRYGQALFHLGSYDKSLEYLEKAKNLSPDDTNISSLLNEVSSKKSSSSGSSKVQDFPKDRGVTIDPPISKKPSEEKNPSKPIIPQEEHKKENPTQAKKKDKIKEVPVEEPKIPVKEPTPTQFTPPPNMRMPNLSQDHMARGMEELKNMTPESMAQMASTLKNMDPNLMQSIFKSQGINMPPEKLSKMAEMITPETINMMTNSFAHGGPTPSSGPSTSQVPPFDPSNLDIASMLNNPEISKLASEMLAKQFGKRPEDVQIIIGCLGKCMNVISKVAKVYRFFTAGNRKYIVVSFLVFLIAHYFGYLS
ncbi:hypothetical protein SteCoe_22530 [Stentor coeruleus]|uniref:Uncharacterized protein n=1 Tax=Stentor coeruleus TaxID=5963 RepID=A0A1R2BM00_9CILI|nr:hypothetical protein SteCoe_22530 [Stentor coeruleus]